MTATRDELHRLVDQIEDDKVPSAVALLREVAEHDQPAGEQEPRRRRLASAGIFDSGQRDLSERVEELVAARYDRSA